MFECGSIIIMLGQLYLQKNLLQDFEPAKCNGTKEDCTKLVKCRYTSNDKIPACVYILAHEVNKSAKVTKV